MEELHAKVSGMNGQFYCTTITYHVGLSAVLMAADIWPTSKKKKTFLKLAVASGCPVVELYEISSYFLVGCMFWLLLSLTQIFSSISQHMRIVGC